MHEIEFLIIADILVINSHWSMQRGEHVIAVVIAFRLQKKIACASFSTTACAASALSALCHGRVLAFARLPHAIVAGQSEAAAMEERERGERL